ncbi:MAG: prolipoprotein diacylglyceryl transferase, partial [Reyranella sp.]|nr:prolipoprotein diacylglyceryl transferase [Reyranella sp.]
MTPVLIPYPEIDPVLIQLGPFAIRWYALAYIAGLVIGWQVMRRVCAEPPKILSPLKIDDFLLWAALGVILGGRVGYVLFYKPGFYLENPLAVL